MQNIPICVVVLYSSCLTSHRSILRSFNEAVAGTFLWISSKSFCRSSLNREQTKRKWISSSTMKIFRALQYGQHLSSLGVSFLLNRPVSTCMLRALIQVLLMSI